MSKTVRSLILFGAPLVVCVLNIFHPVHPEHTPIYSTIHPVTGWWIALHVFNLFGFALLGLAAYLLIMEREGVAATVAKAALIVFVPAYVGFDTVIGIGTGNLVKYANQLPLGQLAAFMPAIEAFWNNQTSQMLAIIGSMAWTIAMGASAVSFARMRRVAAVALAIAASVYTGWGASSGAYGSLLWWAGIGLIAAASLLLVRPALPYTLLVLAGILLGTAHIPPFGPLAMICFLGAAAFVVVRLARYTLRDGNAVRT